MRLSSKQLVKIIFLTALLVSSISLARATIGYVGFHNALSSLQFNASNIDLIVSENNIAVIIDLEIMNPTWYEDLRLTSIISTIHYEGLNHTVVISPGGLRLGIPYQEITTRWWKLPENEITVNRPLMPYTSIYSLIYLNLTRDDVMHFLEFYDTQGKYQEYILWRLESRVYVTAPVFTSNLGLEYQFYLKS